MPRFVAPGKSPLRRSRFTKIRKAAASAAAVPQIAISSFFPGATSATATTVATTSITPIANRLYLVSVTSLNLLSVAPNPPTLSGNGISWVLYGASIFDDSGTSLARATLFYGISAAPTAGVLTADFGTQLQDTAIIVVDEATNVNVSSPVVQIAINQNKVAATDIVVAMAAFSSTNNATYGTFSKEATAATATPLGGIANLAYYDVSGKVTIQTAYQIGNSPRPGESWSVACQNSGIAIEINSSSNAAQISLNASVLESDDTASGVISTTVTATGVTREDADGAAGSASSLVALNGATTEDADSAAGVLATQVALNGAATEDPDVAAGTAIQTAGTTLNGAVLESSDEASGSISSNIALTGAAIESPDAASGIISSSIALNGNTREDADLANGSISSMIVANGAVAENPDGAAGIVATVVSLNGSTFENSDISSGLAVASVMSLNGAAFEDNDAVTGLLGVAVESRKIGGDDVPREEYWEVKKTPVNRDDSLDTILHKAYDKAIGRVEPAKPIEVLTPVDDFDYDADDDEVLMLMIG